MSLTACTEASVLAPVVHTQLGPGLEQRPGGLGWDRVCNLGCACPWHRPCWPPCTLERLGHLLATCQADPAGRASLRVVTQQFTVHMEVTSSLVAFCLLRFDFKDMECTSRKPGLAVDVAHHTSPCGDLPPASMVGTPQDSPVSPILTSLHMHSFSPPTFLGTRSGGQGRGS